MTAVIPPPDCKTSITKQMYKARHKNGSSIHLYKRKNPDNNNYKKLTKVIQNIKNTKKLNLSIETTEDPKGGYIAHTLSTQTWKVTQGNTWHLEKWLLTQHPANKTKQEELQRLNLWLWMTPWDKFCGPDIFWQHKANTYPQQQYTKTIKIPYYWRRMGGLQAQRQNARLLYGTSL